MIPVTKTFFPPIDEYQAQITRIWSNQWLTNRGELVLELEGKITSYLNLKDTRIIMMNNGTIPLQIALKLLGKGGEVITTPFSYVATTAAIVWENCTPVFVDIHPEYLTIDESKIEEAITDKTTCILATHVFGNPCNIEVIESIAHKHNLKVIYDAAHCFGVTYQGKSIFEYGDISTTSFHATKLFHTGEGGALFTKDQDLFHQCFYSHNFGHNGPLEFHGLGINGKISELHAAMGLAVLPHMEDILLSRKVLVETYNKFLDWSKIQKVKLRNDTFWNYSYFPILFDSEEKLLVTVDKLNGSGIHPRRYFYPSLNNLSYIDCNNKNEISNNVAQRILCLPLYHNLSLTDVNFICQLVLAVLNDV
jgi:dTDP-4-amino-4,6-dideoxygalactose transaminase